MVKAKAIYVALTNDGELSYKHADVVVDLRHHQIWIYRDDKGISHAPVAP